MVKKIKKKKNQRLEDTINVMSLEVWIQFLYQHNTLTTSNSANIGSHNTEEQKQKKTIIWKNWNDMHE